MLSQTARYALIILGNLVDAGPHWRPVERISTETCVPANYLSKILVRLAKDGVVESLKGRNGGYRISPASLGRPIRDVLSIIDGTRAAGLNTCVFGFETCDDAAPCPLHEQWSRVRGSFEGMLANTTIGDLRSPAIDRPRRRPCT
ncbi:MAG TPA: Rrf2 family transcriptional regulator [Candidatus Krumholzibacteria bacterium]|nr:Rrf2 family transcriptional regulator [Candidatus Krumholzibacteria bacterium]HPD70237.1 Rrf2 family transcriptional regulator [Candidatus Krumholzibacteria bacterium]HRY40063.1 Rrf2 family transcriptional regulator [Candidatus Krumholzibacteria bacterium]